MFLCSKAALDNFPESLLKHCVFRSWYLCIVFDFNLDAAVSINVDIVEITSTNDGTLRKIKKMGFFKHGDSHIVVKASSKRHKDIGNINNWRIRLSYADVPFY